MIGLNKKHIQKEEIIHEGVLLSVCVFCSNQSYEKGTPFSNVLRN